MLDLGDTEKNLKILVTGGDGFLGRSVLKRLSKHNHTLIQVSRHISDLEGKVFCDLTRVDSVLKILEEYKPNVIINLAATVNFLNGNITDLYPVNTLVPAILAEYCTRNNSFLIHASSSILHGSKNTVFSAGTPEQADTDYGLSKLLADKNILASGCKSAILRFGGIFGTDGPNHLGINRAIQDAKLKKIPTIVGTGSALRNYIYVEDASLIIEKCLNENLRGIFYAGGEVISIKKMLEHICDVFLPGEKPLQVDGLDAQDQVIEVSPELDKFRSFLDSIIDCKLKSKETEKVK